jgi:hypothetical protein
MAALLLMKRWRDQTRPTALGQAITVIPGRERKRANPESRAAMKEQAALDSGSPLSRRPE